MNKEQSANTNFGLIEAFGGIIPEAQAEDYEEQAFAYQMKKKKKCRKQGGKK